MKFLSGQEGGDWSLGLMVFHEVKYDVFPPSSVSPVQDVSIIDIPHFVPYRSPFLLCVFCWTFPLLFFLLD